MELNIIKIRRVANQIGCGLSLTKDLLTLAGDDVDLVLQASNDSTGGVESLKAAIIDGRFNKLEKE